MRIQNNKQFIEEYGKDIFNELSRCIDGKKSQRIKILHSSSQDKYQLTHKGFCLLDDVIVVEWMSNIYTDVTIIEYGDDILPPPYIDKDWIRQIKFNRLLINPDV